MKHECGYEWSDTPPTVPGWYLVRTYLAKNGDGWKWNVALHRLEWRIDHVGNQHLAWTTEPFVWAWNGEKPQYALINDPSVVSEADAAKASSRRLFA